jgi:3-methyladenine DNA glycosylase AlkD
LSPCACGRRNLGRIRKAVGWILRDLAWVDPYAVVAFVEGPGAGVLSGLSKREALKNVRR